ncbi:MAG TPA: hypothetical protein VHL08_05800 [Dongiaceae bacterium]|jgi:hypothetical protein|nr:hypothetical protein [Dongiaceae bacterium]
MNLAKLIPVIPMLLLLSAVGHTQEAETMDCSDMLMGLGDSANFTMECKKDHSTEGQARATHEFLNASSTDGSTTIFAVTATAGRRTYEEPPTMGQLVDGLLRNHGDVKDGQDVAGMQTIETTDTFASGTVPCVVFLKKGRREDVGFKRVDYGVVCTRDGASHAYEILAKMKLPS